jgi:DNA-binding HxlR family transcriptional regulator
VKVLEALTGGPLPLVALRQAVGSPPETTLRKHLQALTGLDILKRARQRQFPAPVSYELSSSGRGLVDVAGSLADWLAVAPGGPLQIGTPAANVATKALVEAWSTKILRALAARPLTLTQLDKLIHSVNYPALERRLGAMRSARQIAPAPRIRGGTPYILTKWLRGAVGPLMAAAFWEHRHTPVACEPLGRLEVETAFLLLAPLLQLRAEFHGTYRLAMELADHSDGALAGVVVTFDQGKPTSYRTDLRASVTGSAIAPAAVWLTALGGSEPPGDGFHGDRDVARAVVTSLRAAVAREHGRAPAMRSGRRA